MLTPRLYQEEGIHFLRSHLKAGCFDDPGLGKSVQASEAAETPTLILCPEYLIDQWDAFLREQYPNQVVIAATGRREDRAFALSLKADWYIANHEMIRETNRKGKMFSYKFPPIKTVVVDEAHHFRGRNANMSRQLELLSKQVIRVYLLTGTPVYKDAGDLYQLLRYLDPNRFTSYYRFIERYCLLRQNQFGTKIVGIKNAGALRSLLQEYSIRRTYETAGRYLPPVISSIVKVKFTSEHQVLYNAVKKSHRTADGVPLPYAIQMLHELRSMTVCEEKLSALQNKLQDLNAPVVLFCHYRRTAELASQAIDGACIHGDLSGSERFRLARQCAASGKSIVCTMDSLSEGIDLSAYRQVGFFEEDYTFGKMDQCMKRVQRDSPNQEPINAFFLQVEGTVDVTVHTAVAQRISDARQILGMAQRQ